MAVVKLKGLNRNTKRLADGRTVVYWYAWKGGPALPGQPGDEAFLAAYSAAHAARKVKDIKDTLAGLVIRYRGSPEFRKNADSTKAEWNRWLDRIAADEGDLDIGALPLKALDDRRVRAEILEWRDQWAATPRSADYAIQVLSRVLSFGMDRGLLALNAVAGVSQLYDANRADQIWTAADLQAFADAAPSPEVAQIPALAALTGFRRTDLTQLGWTHVGDLAIVMATGKSQGRKTQTIPLLPETRQLLADIRAQQLTRHAELCARAVKKRRPTPPTPTTVLTNTRGQAWSSNGLEHQVVDTKTAAGIDKHLHDCRGTFATRLRAAGLSASEIADIMGWEEGRVEKLLKTYVDQDAIIMDLAARISLKTIER